ncbi:F-box protein PP2-B1 [Vitis vinifera]|uniref:F-box protein PP2-B1 n=1 Tax=Vitis vinifera TaxID=29760 RepID=A0A438JEJ7_VITVI|nr:F-box protein PP2-B1 [Vitis vinifera]
MERKNVAGNSAKHSAAGHGFSSLPEGCIADVLALTSPRDVCRMSAVASVFLSAAESDALWERFLPADYREIIARSSESSSWRHFSSKKELYFSLCDYPLLIDEGKKSFWLEKRSGKKCYMLASRELTIIWGDTPGYWEWTSLPESRFPEVAYLQAVCWFEIRGKINTCMLSPRTNYAAYLVFHAGRSHGFEDVPVESSIEIVGNETTTRVIYLARYRSEEQAEHDDLEYECVSIEDVRSWINDNLTQLYSSQEPGKALLGLEDVKTWMNSNVMKLFSSQENEEPTSSIRSDLPYPKKREDSWFEIELGEFFIEGGEDTELEITLMEVKAGHWKDGLIVEGIEIRPKGDL